ncbi:MAG: TonB-dependent receptor plug domain-containing protein [Treponema sp.]|nr:TonB-dependent receptor plug domain-containing protein [Treponema sp.]
MKEIKELKKVIAFMGLTGIFFTSASPLKAQEITSDPDIQLPQITTYLNNENPVSEERQVFTSEDIEEKNLTDLPSLLTTAGIQLLSYGPYGLEQKASIRGFTDETVRIVIDGICVNNSQYGTFDLSTINLEEIEKIEILRGGFTESVCDEDAVGGAIYITTKKQEFGNHFYSDSSVKTYFNSNKILDSFNQSLGYSGNFNNNFIKLNGQGTFANNSYPYINYNKKLVQRENAEVLDGNTSANFLHYFKDGSSLSLNDLFYAGDKNTPGSASTKKYGNQKDLDNILSMQLVNPDLASGKMKIENNLSWISNTRFYKDSSSDSKHYINSVRYNFTDNVDYCRQFKQNFGLSFDYTHLDSTDDGIHNQFSGALKITSKVFLPINKDNQENSSLFGASIPLAIKFCGQNFAFTPKIGISGQFPLIDLSLRGYKLTQFPTMDDLYWNDGTYKGNPDLRPEDGWGGEISLSTKTKVLPFTLCIFSNYYKNKIQWAGTSPQNISSAFYLGCDFTISQNLLGDRIQLQSYTEYLYNRLLNRDNQYTYGKRIMWTPDFVSSFSANFYFPKIGKNELWSSNLLLEANYVGKRYITNMNTTYLSPYLLINISGNLQKKGKKNQNLLLIPYFRLDNLLNWSYCAIPDYPMPGMSLSLGFKIKS